MAQRFRIHFTLIYTTVIIFALCITEDKAGVVLRNFKSRRMIMEELEEEEKILKARVSLNFTNSTDETLKSSSSSTKTNLSSPLNKTTNIDDLTLGLKNISEAQAKNSKVTSKKKISTLKSQKPVIIAPIKNKTSSRKQQILTNSEVEYLDNSRGKRDTIWTPQLDNTNKNASQILTNSVVEYLVNSRGKRVDDTVLTTGSEHDAQLSNSSEDKSAPFRLISLHNESVAAINEITGNSSLEDSDFSDEVMSENEQKQIFSALQELNSNTLEDSELYGEQNVEDKQLLNVNFTDAVQEIFRVNSSEFQSNSLSESALKPRDKENNDSKMPEGSNATDFGNLASENQEENFELKIPLDGLNSSAPKNFIVSMTEDTKNSLNDELGNQVKRRETKDNESSFQQSEIKNDVKPIDLQEPSDIIKETAEEIAEILPESNEIIAIENIKDFVVNLTDTVKSMSDEDIIHFEPNDEHISQSVQNEDISANNVTATMLNDTTVESMCDEAKFKVDSEDKQLIQLIQNEGTVRKDNISTTNLNDTSSEFELSLESVVSSGLDFIKNSEVAKNAALAMEVFNLSDSSLTDHVIEDSDMHSIIDIMMPSVSLNEIEHDPKDQELFASNVTIPSNSSIKVIKIRQKNSTLNTKPKINATLDEKVIVNTVIHSAFDSNATSAATERKCPTPGICVFWFMARDTCSDHSECLGEKMCCRVRCSKNCIDI